MGDVAAAAANRQGREGVSIRDGGVPSPRNLKLPMWRFGRDACSDANADLDIGGRGGTRVGVRGAGGDRHAQPVSPSA